jgi:hydroxyisourate hydrolase
MSQLSSHILDTSAGKPAAGILVELFSFHANSWLFLAKEVTNKDGRISDFLPQQALLEPAAYRLIFHTAPYFSTQKIKSFYPSITIDFEINDSTHYHVPLLLNPFGYSTYRGS